MIWRLFPEVAPLGFSVSRNRFSKSLWVETIASRAAIRLGERQELIYLPFGLIVMSYLRSVWERFIRASYGFISFFVSRTPFG